MLCAPIETSAHGTRSLMVGAVVACMSIAVLLPMPAAAQDRYESILTGTPQPLAEILPKRVLETLQPPVEPIRVASRPSLNWRPGLSAAPSEAKTEPAAEPSESNRINPNNRSNNRAPLLVAPLAPTGNKPTAGAPAPETTTPETTAPPRTTRGESDAGVLLSDVLRRPAPDPSVLPLRSPCVPATGVDKEAGIASSDEGDPSSQSDQDTRFTDSDHPPRERAGLAKVDTPESKALANEMARSEASALGELLVQEPEDDAALAEAGESLGMQDAPMEIGPIDAKPIESAASASQQDPTSTAEPKRSISRSDNDAQQNESTEEAKPSRRATVKKATEPPPPLSRSLRNLRSRLRTVLSYYYARPLNTAEHDPWEIMHGMLAYELHSRVRDGGPRGPFLTSVGHLCYNRPSEGKRMMVVTKDGKLDVEVGVSLQGHRGQFLAMLAQCNVSPDYPIRVEGRSFTIRDLIEAEQRTCYAKTELTFKLIGLGHYLDSDAKWLNDQGEAWDIPRLIAEERAQPIRGAACGGTHRLAGLSLAFRRREARGEPIDGEYAAAQKFVAQYQSYAYRLQNDDGSLSTEWFRGPGREEDIERRLRTSGHTLEWLVFALSDEELRSYRTVRAVNYLTSLLAGHADQEWHLGSIAHALHALVMYDKRVFRPHDADASKVASAVDPTGRLFRNYPIYRGVMRNSPPEPSGIFGLFGGSRTGSAAGRRSR